ncbi:cell division ATP-binding protein FtsE [Candidatus Saccharibacteria bacterium]|nr:cell division ATP-binding protein FtsE [Candidatus Saccharibacteria bacterium]
MILLDSVTKRYPGDAKPALDNVSLHIEPNEFVFLVGKSGAGKSTLIKMLTKEEVPDSGKIIIGGIDLDYVKKRHIPGYRRRLGVVFQDFKLLPRRTVYENVAFALEIIGMSGKDIRKTVPKVLELVDLSAQAKKFPSQLSGGQRQRVSIARSVARQPKILIADEPTGSLDKLTTQEIIDLLRKINDFGTTILVTTHNENIVNNLQKRVVTLKDGRIISDQKNNGIYKLDATPVPEKPERIIQAPGHALKETKEAPKVAKPAAPKITTEKITTEKITAQKIATPKMAASMSPTIKRAVRTTPRRKIAKSNVI